MDEHEEYLLKMTVFIKHWNGKTNKTILDIAKSSLAVVDPLTKKRFPIRVIARCLSSYYPISYHQARRYVEKMIKTLKMGTP